MSISIGSDSYFLRNAFPMLSVMCGLYLAFPVARKTFSTPEDLLLPLVENGGHPLEESQIKSHVSYDSHYKMLKIVMSIALLGLPYFVKRIEQHISPNASMAVLFGPLVFKSFWGKIWSLSSDFSDKIFGK